MSERVTTKHKDGNGRTSRFSCGCTVVRRDTSYRYSLCGQHQRELTDSWLRAMTAHPDTPDGAA